MPDFMNSETQSTVNKPLRLSFSILLGALTLTALIIAVAWAIIRFGTDTRKTLDASGAVFDLALFPAVVVGITMSTTLIALVRSADNDPMRKSIGMFLGAFLKAPLLAFFISLVLGVLGNIFDSLCGNLGVLAEIFAVMTAFSLFFMDISYMMKKPNLMYVASIIFTASLTFLTWLLLFTISCAMIP